MAFQEISPTRSKGSLEEVLRQITDHSNVDPSWEGDSLSAFQEITKVSLPCSQQSTTGPYFEPDESTPDSQNLIPKDPRPYYCPI
jgi:hypothetical protein